MRVRNGKAAMTKGERDDLIKLIKQRERAQKTATAERSKELLADFERHLGTIFMHATPPGSFQQPWQLRQIFTISASE